MADEKKGIIIYADWLHTFEELENDEAGILIKHILRYVNDLNPVAPDKLTKVAFEPIKQQLKRDLRKWEISKIEKSKSGHLGGIKSGEARRKQKEANEANASKSKQSEANEAVSVIVSDNVIVTTTKTEEFILICLESQKWLEAVCMKAKVKLGDFVGLFEEYKIHLVATATIHLNLKDFQSHFVYWIIKKPKQTTQSYNDNSGLI